MAYKYVYLCSDIQHAQDGTVSGRVDFKIRDDAASGILGSGELDAATFAPTYPINDEAAIKTQAVSAITGKYSGATEETE